MTQKPNSALLDGHAPWLTMSEGVDCRIGHNVGVVDPEDSAEEAPLKAIDAVHLRLCKAPRLAVIQHDGANEGVEDANSELKREKWGLEKVFRLSEGVQGKKSASADVLVGVQERPQVLAPFPAVSAVGSTNVDFFGFVLIDDKIGLIHQCRGCVGDSRGVQFRVGDPGRVVRILEV